ncbi:MAG: SH3 domain-containing protein [Casimicrobiaceae bacterium]
MRTAKFTVPGSALRRFTSPLLRATAAIAAVALALPAAALEFRSTAEATILYDGPSLKSQKVFVVGRDYPFEIVVSVEGWAKVRDMGGAPLAWVERKALSDKRMVVVKSGPADVVAAPEAGAKTVFRVESRVLLELVEPPVSGWVKVRHRDGQTGYVNISQIWGV